MVELLCRPIWMQICLASLGRESQWFGGDSERWCNTNVGNINIVEVRQEIQDSWERDSLRGIRECRFLSVRHRLITAPLQNIHLTFTFAEPPKSYQSCYTLKFFYYRGSISPDDGIICRNIYVESVNCLWYLTYWILDFYYHNASPRA
jgi:hypothetical protein